MSEVFWMLFSLGMGSGIIGYVAIQIYDRMNLPRSRCPICGRWRYEAYHCVEDYASVFECRKCKMLWMDARK